MKARGDAVQDWLQAERTVEKKGFSG